MIKPIGNRVLVKVIEEAGDTGPGGFVKAEGARKDKPLFGEVISLGGSPTTGTVMSPADVLNIGDKIYFSSYGYDEIGEYLVVPSDLILGVER